MEKSKRVETYEVRLYCDECGEEMKEVEPGVVLLSSPPKYAYHCINPDCSSGWRVVYSTHHYPYIYYTGE